MSPDEVKTILLLIGFTKIMHDPYYSHWAMSRGSSYTIYTKTEEYKYIDTMKIYSEVIYIKETIHTLFETLK